MDFQLFPHFLYFTVYSFKKGEELNFWDFHSLRSLKCQFLWWLCLLCRVTMIGNNLTLDISPATFYCNSFFFLKSWCCLFSMQMCTIEKACVFLGWKKWRRNYGLPHHHSFVMIFHMSKEAGQEGSFTQSRPRWCRE